MNREVRLRSRVVDFCVALVFIVVSAGFSGCQKKDDVRIGEARSLATEFHKAILAGDTRKMVDSADVPFKLDEKLIEDPEKLKEAFDKNRGSMLAKARPQNKTEVVSYEDLESGVQFNGAVMTKSEVEVQAKRVRLNPGGYIVRCYYGYEDPETKTLKEDGRAYFLVMHPNALGDLKVTTYYD